MAISDKLNYLIETKQLFKDRLNSLGAEIIKSTTFRNYLNWLDTFYGEVSNKTDLAKNGVVGRTSQKNTTGKNLWGGYSRNATTAGIYFSYNKDGSIFINGTATANAYSVGVSTAIANKLYNILEAGTYTVSKDSSDYDITLYDTDNNNILNLNDSTLTGTFTLNSEIGIIMRLKVNNGTTITNKTAYIQIESGNIATDWETYTGGKPSPSSDYPQSINNLSEELSYKVSGKNLFDDKLTPQFTPTNTNWYSLDGINNFYNSTNVAKSNCYFDFKANVTYAISIHSLVNLPNIQVCNSSGTSIISNFNTSTIYTPTEDIRGWFRSKPDTANITTQAIIQIEINDQVTTYEPYVEPKTFLLSLGTIELCKIGDYQDYIYKDNGRWYLHKEIGKIVLNGSENWVANNYDTTGVFYANNYTDYRKDSNKPYSNYFVGNSNVGNAGNFYVLGDMRIGFNNSTTPRLYVRYDSLYDGGTTTFKNWLSTHNTIVYYVLATPIIEEITEENYPTLCNQLKDIQDYLVQYKINNEFILEYNSPEIEY